YEIQMKVGDRLSALASIRRCVEAAPSERTYADLKAALEARRLPHGVLPLRIEGRRVVLVGAFPADICREAGCRRAVRDPGVSRAHAQISLGPEGWLLSDLASRNGTFLGGVRLASPLPLREEGSFRLGERSIFRFVAS